jgi:hypothetical protein
MLIRLAFGKGEPGELLVWPEKYRDVTDACHQNGIRSRYQLCQQRVAGIPVAGMDSDLDEFVVVQGSARLGDGAGAQRLLAYLDHRFE